MRGLKRWAALLGIISLLTVVILAGTGFALAQWDGQQSEEEDGGSGDGFPTLTPRDIIDYIVDWLQGDDPAPHDGDEVEDPVSDEEQPPAAEEPDSEEVPPTDMTSPTPENGLENEPREKEKEPPGEAAEPAQALQEGLEEHVESMGSISGCKFLDANCNGTRDEGEPGIAGVGIHLEDGCKDWCAITAEDGSYAFTGLEPGSYKVEVIEKTVPEGHFHTTERDEVLWLKPECMNRVVDFGNGVRGEVEPGSISGCKFLDANCNGTRDEGEPGIAGVGIHLEDGCKDWYQTTDENGSYAFTGLEPGSYEVEVIEKTVPAGHFHTTERDEVVFLKPGHMDRVVDFGNGVHDCSISGRKWLDRDADGEFSFCDVPLAGVEIELWLDGQLVATRTTSNAPCDKGAYCFDGLEPGTYTVREVSPEGLYPTSPEGGEWTVELQTGERRDCVNFLNARSLSISGTKWEWRDENGDGLVQEGEKYPLQGITLQLSSPCSPEPVTAVTAADGTYAFERLALGVYTVTEVLPEGWYAVDPDCGCRMVKLICDYDQSGVDFVNCRYPSISGNKWEWVDDNGNSEVDEGEYYPVAGIEIRLLQDGEEILHSTYTDANGGYSFDGLEPGTYTVAEVLTQEWYAMDPAGGVQQVVVRAGIDAGGVDFLNSQVEVAAEVVTPITPASESQVAGELPHTGMNQVPLILVSSLLVLIGLVFLALGMVRRFSA